MQILSHFEMKKPGFDRKDEQSRWEQFQSKMFEILGPYDPSAIIPTRNFATIVQEAKRKTPVLEDVQGDGDFVSSFHL